MRNSKQAVEKQEGYFLGGYKTESGKQGFFGDIDGKPVNAVVNKKGELSFFDDSGILKSEIKESQHGEFYIVTIYGKEYLAAQRFSKEKKKKYIKLSPSKEQAPQEERAPEKRTYETKRSSYNNNKPSNGRSSGGYNRKGKSAYTKSAPKPYTDDYDDVPF